MGIIKRQGLKSSIVNYIGVFIGIVFFILIFPNIISKEYLGLISLLQYMMYILIALPTLGLGSVLIKYFPVWEKSDPKKTGQFNGFALSIMSIASLLVTLGYLIARPTISAYYQKQSALFIPYYDAVIPMFWAYTFITYFEYVGLINMRSAVPTFLREILQRLLLIAVILLFYFGYINEQTFVWSLSLAYIIPCILLIIYVQGVLQFPIYSPKAFIQHNPELKNLIRYGIGIFLVVLFATVHNFLDGIILPAYLGLGMLGIYYRPLVLGQMIQVPYRAIGAIASPVLREALFEENHDKLNHLHKNISLNLFLIGAFLFTLLVVNAHNIFMLIPSAYRTAIPVLYIIASGRLLDMAFGLNTEIITYSKYYRYIVVLSGVMMFSTIGLNICFIPRWGMIGAASAVSLSLIVFNILKTWVIFKTYKIHCFSKHYITIACVTILAILVCAYIPYVTFLQHHMFFNPILNIACKTIIAIIFFLLPIIYFKVSPDLNNFIHLIITGKIFKGGHKLENL